jgi:hypothetical protein
MGNGFIRRLLGIPVPGDEEEKRKKELFNLLQPYINQAKSDQRGAINANPDYKINDIIPKTQTPQERSIASLMPFNHQEKKDISPINYQAPMGREEWMANHGWLLGKTIGADSLPWAIRSGAQNTQASLIKGGLAQSADQIDTSKRKWFETNVDTGLKLQDQGRKQHETTVQYGNNQSLESNMGTLAQLFGLPDMKFDYAKTPGYRPQVAQSQIDKNNAQGQASLIRANNPSRGGRGGSGGGSSDKEEKAYNTATARLQNLEDRHANWVYIHKDKDLDFDETKSPVWGQLARQRKIVADMDKRRLPLEDTAEPQAGQLSGDPAKDAFIQGAITQFGLSPEQAEAEWNKRQNKTAAPQVRVLTPEEERMQEMLRIGS